MAKTFYIDNGGFLKISKRGSLKNDAIMTDYFYKKGLSAKVIAYQSTDFDYLITEKIEGQDGIAQKYLDNPKKLCDIYAECLFYLHSMDYSDCPLKNRTETMLSEVERVYKKGSFDAWLLAYVELHTPSEAYEMLKNQKHILKDDALLHGDYCLPNILLDDFKFSGFIDVGFGGVGDRHYDLFWGIWTLQFNLKTNAYKNRFLDCYGRNNIDMDRLKLSGIISSLTYENTLNSLKKKDRKEILND